jgi:hypothetical protein
LSLRRINFVEVVSDLASGSPAERERTREELHELLERRFEAIRRIADGTEAPAPSAQLSFESEQERAA